MPFEYISVEAAISAPGLRMVVVSNVPSPWGEAAKGILHMKRIPWQAVRLVYDDPTFDAWAKDQSGPIAIYEDDPPRGGWREILELAERLSPTPSLIAADADAMFTLCHNLLGENGLGWARRLQLVDAGMKGTGGFPERVAKYIGQKYGYTEAKGAASSARVQALLQQMVAQLEAQKRAGSHYYFGDSPTAADIYSAVLMAMFAPLPEADCQMNPATRQAFLTLDHATQDALEPILLEHRDHMYDVHLERPLQL
ncbi:MAG: hypothetical protein AAGH49_04205 [Pseudomonadota bacterium]